MWEPEIAWVRISLFGLAGIDQVFASAPVEKPRHAAADVSMKDHPGAGWPGVKGHRPSSQAAGGSPATQRAGEVIAIAA
jgi:hypothetical protein